MYACAKARRIQTHYFPLAGGSTALYNTEMDYFLGLDISTTATKALLIDQAGKVIGVASSEYGYATPQPLWSEQ